MAIIGCVVLFTGQGKIYTKIDDIQTKMNSSANSLATRTDNSKEKIQDTLDTVRLLLIIVATVMLFLAFLGFLFSILGMKFIVSILVIIGWILVAGTFLLCGVFLLLHNCNRAEHLIATPRAV